jgi:hypothetical protein
MKLAPFVCLAILASTIVLAESDRGSASNQGIGRQETGLPQHGSAQSGPVAPQRTPSPDSGLDFAAAVVYPSGGYRAFAVAVADVNGDGIPDLLVANQCSDSECTQDGSIAVMLGNGDGTFQTAVTYDSGGHCPTSIAVGDLNGDGNLDLAITEGAKVGVMLGNGDGTFQAAVMYGSGGYNSAWSAVVADVNGDGNLDVLVANECSDSECVQDGSVGVLLGNGDGTFKKAVAYDSGGLMARSVSVADVNGDGDLDVAVVNFDIYSSTVGVLLGNDDGTFKKVVTYPSGGYNPSAVAIADVNGDGKPDLLVANEQPTGVGSGDGMAGVLLGNGDGTFQAAVAYDSGGLDASLISVGDLDGDGNLDLALVNSYPTSDSVGVLLGNGDGTFQTAATFGSGGYRPFSAAVADVNGDGKPDLLVANQCADDTCATIATVGVLINTSAEATAKRRRSSLNTPK